MQPTEELGPPSPAVSIEVPRSPSLPGDGTPLWDNMSLPSGPSPKVSVPDSNMDLERWAKRGFSEDLALPPRQIEKPFRFLDLPAEIRNMIYELLYYKKPRVRSCDTVYHYCHWDCTCHNYLSTMKRQWRFPPIASVNRRTRQESVSLYCAITDFDWYWDPSMIESNHLPLAELLKFLQTVFDFAARHSLEIKSIVVRSPYECHPGTFALDFIEEAVRFLAPLRKSLDQTGRVHPSLREFKLTRASPLARRLFKFAGSLQQHELEDREEMRFELRYFLYDDPDGSELITHIDKIEEDHKWVENWLRNKKIREDRAANKKKGPERWNGVLRSRSAKAEGPERWNGVLRNRLTKD
ncbi:hypothetical protein KCU81_g1209, partial [Aureobasidium melanogenum]|uniref:2EXR domain-containing protein n=1 Tax=Aureobasidium melanogenum (strain CBS 110374) TaxID=1043003 RepID=A0A074W1A5_AURM1